MPLIIQTFEDITVEVKRIWDQLDLFRTKNIDLSRRRVINASPSINKNDYVIRAEIENLTSGNGQVSTITEVTQVIEGNIGQLDFFIDHTLAILNNASQQLFLASDFTVGSYLIAVKGAALGNNIDFRLNIDAVELLTGTLLQDTVSSGVVTADAVLTKDVPITLDLTKVGTTFPGRDLVLSLRKAG